MSDKNNIFNFNDDEDEIANHSKVNVNNPFKASNDYFEFFSTKLNTRIEQLEELKLMAPVLAAIPKYNPYEVPENYFDELPTLVQEKANQQTVKFSILEWLLLFIKPRVLVPVCSIALIAFLGIKYITNTAQLPVVEIAEETTIEEQLYTIDEATIIEKLTADATIQNEGATEEDNIENYLLENNLDESNLNNEF
jgi:hypothetical protein